MSTSPLPSDAERVATKKQGGTNANAEGTKVKAVAVVKNAAPENAKVDDLAVYCLPDFDKFGPATSLICPAWFEAFGYCLSMKWLDMTETGTKPYNQDPIYKFWYNIPLCVGMCCVPCCFASTLLRTRAAMNERSCEEGCVVICCLHCLCSMALPHMAMKRTAFRKKYDIVGSPCMDCFANCCCMSCMVCQDANWLMANTSFKVPHCSLEEARAMQAKVAASS